MLDTLVFEAPQKVVAKERVDDDMLERRVVCVAGAQLLDVGRIEEGGGKVPQRRQVCGSFWFFCELRLWATRADPRHFRL